MRRSTAGYGRELKQWIASLDGRTRDSHRRLDGTHVKADEKFDNGCRFPGDPEAPAAEVYNCRCTLVAYVPGHDVTAGREKQSVGSLSYEEWKRGVREQQPEAASGRSLERFLELPSVQKRIEKSGMSVRTLADAMREEMRNQGYRDLRAFKTLPRSRQQEMSKHAAERKVERGISDTSIKDALENPLHITEVKVDKYGRPSQNYIGKDATAVVNPETGKITTVYPTGKSRLKKYGRQE
ncbi:phage minor head protein [Olsenella massiliensis]|uniref:phage minor head protein n=1 Tax=Olsenella massiliensis TaxID=1622075 RepID=UPI00071DA1EA|nr:phage minor head protein [Olsenella massiliensis]